MNTQKFSIISLVALIVLTLALVLGEAVHTAAHSEPARHAPAARSVASPRMRQPTLTSTLYLPFLARYSASGLVLNPPANDNAAPITSTISIVYNQTMDPATVNGQTFVVHGAQSGLLGGTLGANGNTIIMTPTSPFKHGDEIFVTLSDAILDTDGNPLTPYAWRFRSVVLPTVVGGTGRLMPHPTTPRFGIGSDYLVTGVALGDLDGDGDLDVIEAGLNGWGDSESVWLNDGLGNFSPHPTRPTFGSGYSQSIALGDLDGDGDLDAVVADWGGPQTVWLNGGGGTAGHGSGVFSPHPTTPSFGGGDSWDVALGDLDGDGDLDAVVANRDGPQTVWFNRGTGDFVPASVPTFEAGSGMGVALGDLDGDGDLDAVVANANKYESDTIWLNDGQGNLFRGSSLGVGESEDIALGDLDGDGDLDAVVVSGSYGPAETKLNDGQGNFRVHPTTPRFGLASENSQDITLGDLDGDGDLDAVIANISGYANTVWLNDGQGNLSLHPNTPDDESFSTFAALGDLDGDGDLDVVFGNDEEPNTVWLNQNPDQADLALSKMVSDPFPQPGDTITYTISVNNSGPFTATGVTVGDALPAGVTFIAASASQGTYTQGVGTLGGGVWNLGTLLVSDSQTLSLTVGVNAGTNSATIITNVAQVCTSNSFDPDSTPGNDLASEDDQDMVRSIVNPLRVSATDPAGNDAVVAPDGDIGATFDRAVDASTVHSATFTVHGAQTGTYTGTYTFPAAHQTQFDAAGIFKPGEKILATLGGSISAGDGAPLAPFSWQARAAVAGGSGLFVTHPVTSGFGADYSWGVALGDLDGDGDLDAVVANTEVGDTVWLNDGTGLFAPHPTTPILGQENSLDVALGDLDGDGDLDAVVAHGGGYPQSVWLNDGAGNLSTLPATLRFGAGYSQAVALGDLDGDGDLDAVLAHEDIGMTVWLNNGRGRFGPHPYTPTFGSGDSFDLALGDLDGDGDLDAVVAKCWGQPQTVWLNDGIGNFDPHPTTPSFGGYPSLGIVMGDLDEDGDLDVVVANAGPNTVWLNDGLGNLTSHPTTPSFDTGDDAWDIALGDLDGDGDLDALEAQTWGGGEVVWLNDGDGNLGLFSTFPSGGSTAVALGDLDDDGDLDAVFANIGNWPENVWLNQNQRVISSGNDTAIKWSRSKEQ
jgi:uncharacterized repeat protein (TIGR01451 family)